MLTIMHKGGPLMWLILFNAILAAAIVLERLLEYHRAQINAPDFTKGIINSLKRGNVTEAVSLCNETPGPVARVVKAAIDHHTGGREDLREAVQDVARGEVVRLERRLVVLATIAQITPLIGFLGTVMGMIQMFQVIQQRQLASPGELAGGVWQALLTTAGGLVVAVPVYVAYNLLISRVQTLVLDMEKAANELIGYASRRGETNGTRLPEIVPEASEPTSTR